MQKVEHNNNWGANVVRSATIRAGTFELLTDGIVICTPSAINMSLADAHELMNTVNGLAPAERGIRLLLDQRTVRRSLTAEARRYLASEDQRHEKIAVLVANAISRFFASSLMSMAGVSN